MLNLNIIYSTQEKLPVLEPGDKLLITKAPDKSISADEKLMMMKSERRLSKQVKCNTPETQRKNVLEKIKDKGKGKINKKNLYLNIYIYSLFIIFFFQILFTCSTLQTQI